jgi:hypothetical protein
MIKFSLGELVAYSNKGYGMANVQGSVIGIDNIEKYYLIQIDDPEYLKVTYKHWTVGSKDVIRTMPMIPEYFNSPSDWGTRRSKSPYCMWVGMRSKNLKNMILQYDPTQQGDRDDDI